MPHLWGAPDDDLLCALVVEYGLNWTLIADALSTASAVQVQSRRREVGGHVAAAPWSLGLCSPGCRAPQHTMCAGAEPGSRLRLELPPAPNQQGVSRRPDWCKARYAILQKMPMEVRHRVCCIGATRPRPRPAAGGWG